MLRRGYIVHLIRRLHSVSLDAAIGIRQQYEDSALLSFKRLTSLPTLHRLPLIFSLLATARARSIGILRTFATMESYYESRPGDPPGTYYYFDGKRPVMKREGGRSFK